MRLFIPVTGMLLITLTAMVSGAQAQVADKKTLTLDGARTAIAAAVTAAHAKNAPGGGIAVRPWPRPLPKGHHWLR